MSSCMLLELGVIPLCVRSVIFSCNLCEIAASLCASNAGHKVNKSFKVFPDFADRGTPMKWIHFIGLAAASPCGSIQSISTRTGGRLAPSTLPYVIISAITVAMGGTGGPFTIT